MSVSSTHISQRPFCGTDANIAGPDEAPQNVAVSPFGLHCLKRLI